MNHDDYNYEFTIKRKNDVILITNNLNDVINNIRPGYEDNKEKYIGEMEHKLMIQEYSRKCDNKEIRKLLKEVKELNETIEILEKKMLDAKSRNYKLLNQISDLEENSASGTSTPNPRGAGRKPKITPEQIAMIQMLRAQGKKLTEIQEETGISYGNIQKYCKLITDNNKKRAGS